MLLGDKGKRMSFYVQTVMYSKLMEYTNLLITYTLSYDQYFQLIYAAYAVLYILKNFIRKILSFNFLNCDHTLLVVI